MFQHGYPESEVKQIHACMSKLVFQHMRAA